MEKFVLWHILKINNTGFKTEIGSLIENIIYNELVHRGYEVYVGKTVKGEIDFIVMDGNYPKFILSMDKYDFSRDGIIHRNIIDFLLDKDR